eukprot:g12894.t1
MPLPKIAIVGRPNVGKSSLMNRLAGRKISIVDPTAGVTRDRVSTPIEVPNEGDDPNKALLIDTGGYGIEDSQQLTAEVEQQIANGLADADLVLFLVDAQAGVVTLDETVAKVLRTTGKESKPILLANVSRHYLAMLCPGPSAQDELRYPSKVLADVLGDSDGSRLYWALVDPGLADEADFSFWPHDQTGAFMAYASCDPDRAVAVEAKLLATLDGITGEGFDIGADEVQRAINKLVTRATLQGERPAGRMQALGAKWLYHGRYVSLDEELDNLLAVEVDDLAEVLGRYTFKPRTIVTLGPEL